MKTYFRDLRLILQYGGLSRHTPFAPGLWLAVQIALLLTGFGVGISMGAVGGFNMMVLFFACIFSIAFTLIFVAPMQWWRALRSAAELNTPALSRLTPQSATRTRRVFLQSWLVFTTLAAAIPGLLSGYFGWFFLGIGSLLLTIAVRSQDMPANSNWQLLEIPTLAMPWIFAKIHDNFPAILQSSTISVLAMMLLAGLAWQFFNKDFLNPAGRQVANHGTQTPHSKIEKFPNLDYPAGYGKELRQACHSGKTAPMLRQLIPGLIPWRNLGTIFKKPVDSLFLAIILGLWFAKLIMWLMWTVWGMWDLYPLFREGNSQNGFVISPFALLLLFKWNNFDDLMAQTRGEQALVRLSPLLKKGADLNRNLIRLIFRETFCDWLFRTGMILAATALFGISAKVLLVQFALCCAMGLPRIFAPVIRRS